MVCVYFLRVLFQTADGFTDKLFRRNRAESATIGAFRLVVTNKKIRALTRYTFNPFKNFNAFLVGVIG